jgi:hypothetical protein
MHQSEDLLQRVNQQDTDCRHVLKGSQPAKDCQDRKDKLMVEVNSYYSKVEAFNAEAQLTTRVEALDKQIAETEKQLRGLGFKKAVPDFAWFAGQSQQAQQQMVSQLISRMREYATDKSEDAMKDRFLTYIGTTKEKEVKNLANFLKSKGADEPLFQEWLRSFSPKASRAVLVDGAKLAIDAVKKDEDLFKIGEEMDKETVQGRQEAALTLISMVVEYPGMKELKLVASGAYDVIEAGVTICILDRGINDLMTATETQLAKQKQIMLRMKALVDERTAARKKLSP